jgi:3-dehydroquinate dehydratase-1
MHTRPITLNGTPLAGGQVPAVCVPLVARTAAELQAEAAQAAARQPDLLEWRVDFFEGIGDAAQVVRAAGAIRQAAGGIPLLFTRRREREGGQPIALDEAAVVAVYRAVCQARAADAVDFEMGNDEADVRAVREASAAAGIALFLSFHDFAKTPPSVELVERFRLAHRLGADVAKVAVMPQAPEDVLVLLQATLAASRALPIPVVSMSMAGLGALTRVVGAAFGSAMTFAVGQQASAPGQLPVDELRAALGVLRRAGAA